MQEPYSLWHQSGGAEQKGPQGRGKLSMLVHHLCPPEAPLRVWKENKSQGGKAASQSHPRVSIRLQNKWIKGERALLRQRGLPPGACSSSRPRENPMGLTQFRRFLGTLGPARSVLADQRVGLPPKKGKGDQAKRYSSGLCFSQPGD